MSEELFIPKLGQTVEEVTLVEWTVQDGAKVEFGQSVLEVETDKAVFPIEANADGYIHIGPYQKGQVVPVLAVVALIGKKDEVFAVKTTAGSTPAGEATAAVSAPVMPAQALAAVAPSSQGKVFASPRARKLALEKDVDLAQVQATGGGGVRVVEKDVQAYLAQAPRVTPLARRIAEAQGVDLNQVPPSGKGGALITRADVLGAVRAPAQPAGLSAVEVIAEVPLKGVRGIIADRMAASVHTSARVTLFMDVDATEFVAWRERLKTRFEKVWGFAPGYNDLLAKICAAALVQHPYMNARLSGVSGSADAKIEQLGHVNIGIAVDTERGLLVPVVRDAALKSLQQFGSELRQMVVRARSGRSLPDDLSGGTFTITNLGMYDVEGFTPVINLPECAILGVGRITPKPVYVGSDLVRREMMTLSLVFDHRLVDGAPAARFMQLVRQMVEDPSLLGAY